MSFLYSILSFGIVIGIIAMFHEIGHYIAARIMGVRVEIFSFGFGKRLLGKKLGKTDFRLSLIPLAGYVKMAGEEKWDPNNAKPGEFHAKNRGQKIFILFMGPAMNIIMAFLIFTIINLGGVVKVAYRSSPPQVGYVAKGSPAENAGIQKGDIIRTIDRRPIANWEELEIVISANPNQGISVEFERDGQPMKTILAVKRISRHHIGDTGIDWGFKTRVQSVTEDSPAFHAGLKADDIILAVDNEPICIFELVPVISRNAGKPLQFQVKRGENLIELEIVPEKVYFLESQPLDTIEDAQQQLAEIYRAESGIDFFISKKEGKYLVISQNLDNPPDPGAYKNDSILTPGKKGIIGMQMIAYSPTIKIRPGLFAAAKKSAAHMVNIIELILNSIVKKISDKSSPRSLSGPIEIASYSQKAMESETSAFFLLIALISFQFGLLSLLPIYTLEGGFLMIYVIESVTRRDFSQKTKLILANTGFAILIVLVLLVTLSDITKSLPEGWNSLWPF